MIANKYDLISKIGSGAFGAIYKGQNIRTGEPVAIKVEPLKHETNLLKNEARIYQYLKGGVGIPQVKWFGVDDANNYMVINLLGESLQNNINTYGPFSLLNAISIGIQMIERIKYVHECGLIHRDVKPDYFLFGLNEQQERLYIIDFGFCKSIENVTNAKKTTGLIGSLTYASLNAHNYTELSYRDDLESLGYMLIYFYQGYLEWQKMEDVTTIIQMKQAVVNNEKIPIVLRDFIKKVRQLGFKEMPDYNSLISLFKREIENFLE